MKIFISATEYAIVIDLDEASLWEWLTCLEEQYPIRSVKPKREKTSSSKIRRITR